VTSALAQHDGVGQSSGPGRDVDRRSTSKVESAHLGNPARRVPCPACDGVVDHGRPDKHEDDTGQHTAALGDGAHGEGHSDGGEHALVDGEEQVGDLGGANGGGSEDVAEAEVLHVTQELAGGVREGEGVAPEEPLEGDDGGGHDGEPDQGQGGLSAGQTRVEETAAREHRSACPVQRGHHVSVDAHTRHLES